MPVRCFYNRIKLIGDNYFARFTNIDNLLKKSMFLIKGKLMVTSKNWISLGTIVSPITGTFFTTIITQHNHKYVLWYKGDYLIKTGDLIKVCNSGFLIADQLRQINIIQIDKHSATLWRVMQNMSSCPGDTEPENMHCTSTARCIFTTCPHGKVKPVSA